MILKFSTNFADHFQREEGYSFDHFSKGASACTRVLLETVKEVLIHFFEKVVPMKN